MDITESDDKKLLLAAISSRQKYSGCFFSMVEYYEVLTLVNTGLGGGFAVSSVDDLYHISYSIFR